MESKNTNPNPNPNPRSEDEQHMIVTNLQPIISFNNVETTVDNQERGSSSSSTSHDSASSFSSNSSSDEFIQVVPTLVSKPQQQEEQEEEEKVRVSENAILKLEEFFRSRSSNSRISDVTIESNIPDVSQTQTQNQTRTQSRPPLQVMERTSTSASASSSSDYDPNRIPSSVFGKPSSPSDWSAASNDSLFSIHVGNYGSTPDDDEDEDEEENDTTTTKEDYKSSGELMISDEFYKSIQLDISLVKDKIKVPEKTVSYKAKVLEETLPNNVIKIGGFEGKGDNCKGAEEEKLQIYPYSKKQSRCCCSKSNCFCDWLTCQSCSCNWSNCCSKRNCCSNCSTNGCCSSTWTCSIKKIFCCFSHQRSSRVSKPGTSKK